MSLKDRIPADYVRPKCPRCHRTLSFVHVKPGGSRYACLPCDMGLKDMPSDPNTPISNSEASWIIRHGITTPSSRDES